MSEITSPLTVILGINSILLIGFILNQNESSKDTTSNSGATEIASPLQNITWFCVFIEFSLFLLKSKSTEF